MVQNRKARFDYEILETLEVGIALTGAEIKSVRAGQMALRESFVRVEGNELILRQATIASLPNASTFDQVDPTRPRKLLAHRREIIKLKQQQDRAGLTVVPLRVYLVDQRLAKVEVAVARGRKVRDKRDVAAKRDTDRKLQRIVGRN